MLLSTGYSEREQKLEAPVRGINAGLDMEVAEWGRRHFAGS